MTVDKTGKVQAAKVDVPKTKAKKTETQTSKPVVDMTGGFKPVSQNPLDFIEEITGKKPMDNPQMKALQQHLQAAVEAENAKKAQMTPEQRAAYEKEQDEALLAGIEERRTRAENEKTALGRWIQGWKDDFAPVKDAKGAVATVTAAADAVVNRTRKGFGSIDAVLDLPQGTTETVWTGAAVVATAGVVAEAVGGSAALSTAVNTAKTVMANPGTKAVAAVGGVAIAPAALTSCNDDSFDETKNTYVPIPQDTVWSVKEITLPPETIQVVKTDTIKEPVFVYDTTYIDKIIRDTTYIEKFDTTFIDRIDTMFIDRVDTIKVPEYHIDTIKVPEIHTDTLYLPGEVVHDTIKVEIPGPTVTVPEEWESPVPDKQKEILDELGIKVDKSGKFVLSTNYYDEYNYTLSMKNINGGKSSRDGSTIVYDEIKTEWGDNGLELGKNESYRRYQYSLSDDGRNLTIAKFKPVSDLSISNNAGQPNWSVFNNQLNDADQWTYDGIMTLSIQDGQVKIYGTTDMGEGTLSPGDVENSVLFTNPYQGQWRLSDWKVQTGDDNYHKE